MRKKRDFGRLPAVFGHGTGSKPAQGNRGDIRLPSLEQLLEVDAKAELAAREARVGSDEPGDSDIRQGGEGSE